MLIVRQWIHSLNYPVITVIDSNVESPLVLACVWTDEGGRGHWPYMYLNFLKNIITPTDLNALEPLKKTNTIHIFKFCEEYHHTNRFKNALEPLEKTQTIHIFNSNISEKLTATFQKHDSRSKLWRRKPHPVFEHLYWPDCPSLWHSDVFSYPETSE